MTQFPESIAIAGAWGYIGRKFIDAARSLGMRIYVHDYAGHAFAVQLSRALAARGHTVRHGFSSTNLTPQGELARRSGAPAPFEPDPVSTGRAVDKRAVGWAGTRMASVFSPAVTRGEMP